MKGIISFTFCCNNLWKSYVMALEKPENSGNFFLVFCGHPAVVHSDAHTPVSSYITLKVGWVCISFVFV